jgi:head-tail adaptor
MPTPKLNAEIIAAAIEGFESQKRQIDAQIWELRAMLSGGRTEGIAKSEAPTRKRKVSAAARRRMAEGQKRRWAAIKAESRKPESAARPEPAKPKRKISAAGRRAISEAMRRRWTLKRAEGAKAQPTGVKKAATRRAVVKKGAKKAPSKPAKKTAAKATGQVVTSEAVAR